MRLVDSTSCAARASFKVILTVLQGNCYWAAFVKYAVAEHKEAFFRAFTPASGVLRCEGKLDGHECPQSVQMDLTQVSSTECGSLLPKLVAARRPHARRRAHLQGVGQGAPEASALPRGTTACAAPSWPTCCLAPRTADLQCGRQSRGSTAGSLRGTAVDKSADWRTQVIANPERTAEGLGESIASAIVAWPEGELHPRVKSGAQYVLTLKQTQVALLTCGGSKLKDSLRIAWTTSFVRAVDSAAMHSLSSKAWVQAFAQEPGRHSGTQPRRTWKSFIDDLCTHLHSEGNAEQLQRMMGRMQGNAKPSSGIGSMSYLELATK